MNTRNDEIVRINNAAKMLGVSRSTVYAIAGRDKTFPRRIKLSGTASGFLRSELNRWIESRKTT